MKTLITIFKNILGLIMIFWVVPVYAADEITFWDTPQRGANSFNVTPPDLEYFKALKNTNASWIRLTFSKWDGEESDFLIGDIDDYSAIPKSDLTQFIRVLDAAHMANLKVVITPLSLPGSRWKQLNNDKFDDRLWSDKKYWDQSAAFWKDLAEALKDHPAIAAYNIINEPSPEKSTELTENGSIQDNAAYVEKHAGTARDLPAFYNYIIKAIRAVDLHTPIMVDAGYYGSPLSLAAWPNPLKDDKVLYSVHIYEPYEATSYPNINRKVRLRYPGAKGHFRGEDILWDKDIMRQFIGTAFDWAKTQNISSNRIVIGEFGCVRVWQDCGAYLTDILDIFDKHAAHWAFYAFRPDEWDAMDYELPVKYKSGKYYTLIKQGRKDKLPRNGKLMELIKARLNPNKND